MADLANKLLVCDSWDPNTLQSPLRSKIPPRKSLDPNVPFAPTYETSVNIPTEDKGKTNVYIDDNIAIGPDLPGVPEKLEAAISLTIHTITRPLDDDEPILRHNMISLSKFLANGSLTETQIFLGWLLNTRELKIYLSEDKYKSWSRQIETILLTKKSNHKELYSLIGRLNHADFIIPLSRHFLSRIRGLKEKAKFHNMVSVSYVIRQDLKLWQFFLKQTKQGINMNLLTYRFPTHVAVTDACEAGLGILLSNGMAARWDIPKYLQQRAHINLLEFLGQLAAIWMLAIEDCFTPNSCLLVNGDSSTAQGWIRKSTFSLTTNLVLKLM